MFPDLQCRFLRENVYVSTIYEKMRERSNQLLGIMGKDGSAYMDILVAKDSLSSNILEQSEWKPSQNVAILLCLLKGTP